MPFKVGSSVSDAQLEEGVQRLRNLGLFATATYQRIGSVLRIDVEERWTILPAFKFTGGGGIAQLTVALYDINVAGRYLEFGTQYERLGKANSFVVWHRNPRLFDRRLLLAVDLWSTNRTRLLYDRAGEVDGGFLLNRLLFSAALTHENQKRTLRLGGKIQGFVDDFSLQYLTDEAIAAEEGNDLPPGGTTIAFGPTVSIGTINTDNYLQEGVEVNLDVDFAPPLFGVSDVHFVRGTLQATGFLRLGKNSMLGARLLAGGITSSVPQHLYYIGGLDRIRGFLDSRFRGRAFGLANLEARVPSYAGKYVVVQHVAFADAGVVRTIEDGMVTVGSAGLGIRLISPRIFRLVIRLDYALITSGTGTQALAFGIQQFF